MDYLAPPATMLDSACGDPARLRPHLLASARDLVAQVGASMVTMDGLAAHARLDKGTVLGRFGNRTEIFRALLADAEDHLEMATLTGAPPLGPGASPWERLNAYGHARVRFLIDNRDVVWASLEGNRAAPTGIASTSFSCTHIGNLLTQFGYAETNVEVLAAQLASALDGSSLLQLHNAGLCDAVIDQIRQQLTDGWTVLIRRAVGPESL